MRVVVIGTSGAGKTTMTREIAARFNLTYIELDAINWQTGWHDLSRYDPAEFVRRVKLATNAEAWAMDGTYGLVRDVVWRRATHLIWLDYERPVIMARVIGRSLQRVISRNELWAGTGNRERWFRLLHSSHPIRWAWNTWSRRRQQTAELLEYGDYSHLAVLRLRHPREAVGVVAWLRQASEGNPPAQR